MPLPANHAAGQTITAAAVNAVEAQVNTNTTDVATNTTNIALKASKSANLSDLASAATARTNLGLGTAAVKNTGTTGTDVVLADNPALTNTRTPTAHAASHLPNGSDPVTGLPLITRVTSDQSNSTAASGSNGQTAVSSATLAAGSWAYEVMGQYVASASLPGLRTAITFTGTQTAYNIQANVNTSSAAVRNDATNDGVLSIGTLIGAGSPSGTGALPFSITGTIVVTVAGVLNVTFAPSTANAITVKTGTFLKLTPILG